MPRSVGPPRQQEAVHRQPRWCRSGPGPSGPQTPPHTPKMNAALGRPPATPSPPPPPRRGLPRPASRRPQEEITHDYGNGLGVSSPVCPPHADRGETWSSHKISPKLADSGPTLVEAGRTFVEEGQTPSMPGQSWSIIADAGPSSGDVDHCRHEFARSRATVRRGWSKFGGWRTCQKMQDKYIAQFCPI